MDRHILYQQNRHHVLAKMMFELSKGHVGVKVCKGRLLRLQTSLPFCY